MKSLATALAVLILPALAWAADKPDWVDGKSAKYKAQVYLTGVGQGPTRGTAESSAQAAIAKIFRAKIESASKDYQSSFSATGKQPLEVQSIEVLTKVSTEKTLKGVKIAETWDDGKGLTYALATIEREPTAASMRDQIGELDRGIANALSKASESSDNIKKLKKLREAGRLMQERMVLNEELRVVAPDGQGVASEHSAADIAAAMEGVAEVLNVCVQASGSSSGDLQEGLVEGLTKQGLQVTTLKAGGDDDDEDEEGADESSCDLIVRAKSKMEKASVGSGPELARVTVDVELYNPAKQKILASFSESRKEGHRSIEEAARKAVRAMKQKLVTSIQKEIDKYLGKK